MSLRPDSPGAGGALIRPSSSELELRPPTSVRVKPSRSALKSTGTGAEREKLCVSAGLKNINRADRTERTTRCTRHMYMSSHGTGDTHRTAGHNLDTPPLETHRTEPTYGFSRVPVERVYICAYASHKSCSRQPVQQFQWSIVPMSLHVYPALTPLQRPSLMACAFGMLRETAS